VNYHQIFLIVGHIKVGDESRQEGDVGIEVTFFNRSNLSWRVGLQDGDPNADILVLEDQLGGVHAKTLG